VKALVLLSSFRGRNFIGRQIESILSQEAVDLRLIVRDDGSDDDTASLVEGMAAKDPRIEPVRGTNLGFVGSFFELLKISEASDAPFIAFADQDDIWPPSRLARQLSALSALPSTQPALCFGGFLRIDADGMPMDDQAVLPPLPDKGALLSENQVPGCTMVINRAAHRIISADLPPPDRIFAHDWWVEQVTAFVGVVVRVDDVVLHYRQHSANLIGAPSQFGVWRDRLTRIHKLRGSHPLLGQVRELHRRFGDRMSAADRARIERFMQAAGGNFAQRLAHVFSAGFRRARRSDDVFLRLLLLTGYFRTPEL
jgi:glycosyltransferase involved in cell wall biosynthesis